jgi:hypothetical protein
LNNPGCINAGASGVYQENAGGSGSGENGHASGNGVRKPDIAHRGGADDGAVRVGVFMIHLLMRMIMFVTLGEVKPDAPGHEGCGGQEPGGDLFQESPAWGISPVRNWARAMTRRMAIIQKAEPIRTQAIRNPVTRINRKAENAAANCSSAEMPMIKTSSMRAPGTY